MAPNRRNLYRLLQVQPDAAPDVIEAAYRALTALHRASATDGADVALLDDAWRVLSDTARRARYDAKRDANWDWKMIDAQPFIGGCAFCGFLLPDHVHADSRCERCFAPLAPVSWPIVPSAAGERRGVPRVSKSDWALLHVDDKSAAMNVRMRDLSYSGISIYCDVALLVRQRVRIIGSSFDVVADLVSRRRVSSVFVLHAHLLTAQFSALPGDLSSATA